MKLMRSDSGRFIDQETGQLIEPRFLNYTCREDYIRAGVKSVEPMCAKEEDREEELEKMLAPNSGYYAEEKFDGTRGTLHFFEEKESEWTKHYDRFAGYTRCFSRRISKETGWYCENTDSLPQLRELDIPELAGTVIDGELFIPNQPFKAVSSTLNCLWDKALDRQIELGMIVFHAFDIVWYKGVYVARMPLHRRKEYLQKVVDAIASPYVKMVQYSDTTMNVYIDRNTELYRLLRNDPQGAVGQKLLALYPELFGMLRKRAIVDYANGMTLKLSKKQYYEYIVATGGEGLILKDKNGKYYHKRGREYTKLKKFITREVIIMGFSEPTKEYKGKFPDPRVWRYWDCYDDPDMIFDTSNPKELQVVENNPGEFAPVSKYYAEKWVGNVRYGVVITEEETNKLMKSKKWKEFNIETLRVGENEYLAVIEVGECSGYDEPQRKWFTDNKDSVIGKVLEVKANELFKDTGKMRHPRFLRLRPDKAPEQCTWHDHIGED